MRMPCLFANHGAGPMPLLGSDPTHASQLRAIPSYLPSLPAAILVVSAHWEANPLEISSPETHSLYFDYGGFGPASCKFQYPAPGSPNLARRVQSLLSQASLPSKLTNRALDHGSFVPLLLAYPDAKIPVLALSLSSTLSPSTHLSIGRALAPLRGEGVLILGSGLSFHNMRAFDPRARDGDPEPPAGARFDAALVAAVTERDSVRRDLLLEHWERMPGARHAHPREEHLLPLLVASGAAGEDRGTALASAPWMGAACSTFGFGVTES